MCVGDEGSNGVPRATMANSVAMSILFCSENPEEGSWLNSSPTITGASVSIVEKLL